MSTTPVRRLAAASLVTAAVLSLVSVLLQPDFTADPAERLAAIADSGALGTISLLSFALSQLPFMVAVVAIAMLVWSATPRLAWTGGVLAVLGGFGHSVFAGTGLTYLAMSGDEGNREAMGEVVTSVEAGPAVLFMAMGLIGTVLGLVLLGVALFRSGTVPRWVPLALWAVLVMEFVVGNFTEWAAPAAGLLYVGAFAGIAVRIVQPAVPAPYAEPAARV